MRAIKLTISGIVQGVGYRRWFEKQALDLNLKGYVKNLPTGEVEALVVGEDDVIHEILQLSAIGPFAAKVLHIVQEQIDVNAIECSAFKIMR